jgi:hypothetical protein
MLFTPKILSVMSEGSVFPKASVTSSFRDLVLSGGPLQCFCVMLLASQMYPLHQASVHPFLYLHFPTVNFGLRHSPDCGQWFEAYF